MRLNGRIAAGTVALLAVVLTAMALGGRPAQAATAASVYVVAVGDIACDPSPKGDPNYASSYNNGDGTLDGCRQKAVGAAVLAAKPDQFWPLGDNQYFNGTYAKYLESYDKAFGALKDISHPIPGNHEWKDLTLPTKPGSGYFTYFGPPSHPETNGTYSFDTGDWHVLAINDNLCDPSHPCGPGSALATWIASDMAASPKPCTIAMWHHPLWSVGGAHAEGYPPMVPVWNQLNDLGVDVVLTGHDHLYVRTKPLGQASVDPADATRVGPPTLDPNGMVELVIGTGGEDNYAESAAITTALTPYLAAYSAKQSPGLFGALGLHLKSDRYTFSYLPAKDSAAFTDNGGRTCRRATNGNPQDVAGEPAATPATAAAQVAWSPSNTTVKMAGTSGGSITPSEKATTSGDGAITYAVTADDSSGCSVDAAKGVIRYDDAGVCEVTATSAATAKYLSAHRTVAFTITGTKGPVKKQDMTAVQPAFGPLAGGNTITLVGNGFSDASKVLMDGTSATFHVVSDTRMTVVVPAGRQVGPVDIRVTVGPPQGAIVAPGGYTYRTAAVAESVTATVDPAAATTADSALGNPVDARALASGLRLLSRADAARVRPTTLAGALTSTPSRAPAVRVKAGRPFAFSVAGLPPASVATVLARVQRSAVSVGTERADANGGLRIPAMVAARPGTFVLVVRPQSGSGPGYVKVLVRR